MTEEPWATLDRITIKPPTGKPDPESLGRWILGNSGLLEELARLSPETIKRLATGKRP